MWEKLLAFTQQLFLLTQDNEKNKADIKELRQEVREIREEIKKILFLIQQLSFDMRQAHQNEQNEREKLALQLTIKLLEFERRLPSGPKSQANPESNG